MATWAMAETAMVADALATALFFVPGQALEESFAAQGPNVVVVQTLLKMFAPTHL